MLTNKKLELINNCIKLSVAFPDRIFYGFIGKDGECYEYSYENIVKQEIKEGNKIYCKAKNGQLIL